MASSNAIRGGTPMRRSIKWSAMFDTCNATSPSVFHLILPLNLSVRFLYFGAGTFHSFEDRIIETVVPYTPLQ